MSAIFKDKDGVMRIAAPDPNIEKMMDRQFQRIPGQLAWKDPQWRGLGDVIKAVTDKFGFKPCGGCAQRQETLNKILPNPFAKGDSNAGTES